MPAVGRVTQDPHTPAPDVLKMRHSRWQTKTKSLTSLDTSTWCVANTGNLVPLSPSPGLRGLFRVVCKRALGSPVTTTTRGKSARGMGRVRLGGVSVPLCTCVSSLPAPTVLPACRWREEASCAHASRAVGVLPGAQEAATTSFLRPQGQVQIGRADHLFCRDEKKVHSE